MCIIHRVIHRPCGESSIFRFDRGVSLIYTYYDLTIRVSQTLTIRDCDGYSQVAVAAPVYSIFDYLLPVGCDLSQLHSRVRCVPFGRGERCGVLLQVD